MAEGWNYLILPEEGRKRLERRFNLMAQSVRSVVCVSATLSGTLRVCWANEWSLFLSLPFPPLYFLCQESGTRGERMKGSALMMCRNSERREEGTGSKKSSTTPLVTASSATSLFALDVPVDDGIDNRAAEIFKGLSD